MEPGDLQTVDALAQALLNNNQLDEALKQYKQLAEANPDDAEPLIHIAEIERRQGKYRRCAGRHPQGAQDGSQLAGSGIQRRPAARHSGPARRGHPDLPGDGGSSTSHANGAYTDEEKNNRSIFLERLGTVCDGREQDRPGGCRVPEDDRPGRQHCGARLPGRSGCVSRRARVRQGARRGQEGRGRQSQGSRPEADAGRRTRRPGPSRRWTGDGEEPARWRHARRAARRLVRDRADGRAPAPLEGCRRRVRQGRSAGDQEGRPHLFVLPARRAGRAAEAFRSGRAVSSTRRSISIPRTP